MSGYNSALAITRRHYPMSAAIVRNIAFSDCTHHFRKQQALSSYPFLLARGSSLFPGALRLLQLLLLSFALLPHLYTAIHLVYLIWSKGG